MLLMASTVSVERPKTFATSRSALLRAIADDGGGEAGALAAVFVVDVLHHLFAPLVLEIDVDIGRLVALGREEAAEDEIAYDGFDLGDLKAVADHRIGGRAAALAEDFELVAGEVDDVVDGEEVGRVAFSSAMSLSSLVTAIASTIWGMPDSGSGSCAPSQVSRSSVSCAVSPLPMVSSG